MSLTSSRKKKQSGSEKSNKDGVELLPADILESRSKLRRISSLQESNLNSDNKEKRGPTQRRDDHQSDHLHEDLEIFKIEGEVRELGDKILAFREKGINSFVRLSVKPAGAYADCDNGLQNLKALGAENEAEEWRTLKDRIGIANEVLLTLLNELATWNTKIQQAVGVGRNWQRLPGLEEDDALDVVIL